MAQPTLTLSSALQDLSTSRVRGHRDSNEIVRKGLFVLEQKNGLKALGGDIWDFLEQLTIAALDIGQVELADDCITRLDVQFPKSPRVDVLRGMRIEAKDLGLALEYYEHILENEESNVVRRRVSFAPVSYSKKTKRTGQEIWKRLIAVLRQQNKIEKCISELVTFLDTFYSDLEGWLELADLYASLGLYTRSLQALSHALLLAPQNPFHTLRFAETAYTSNDVPLALRYYLRTIELIDPEDDGKEIGRRAWFGVKLCARHLSRTPNLPSESNTPPVQGKNLSALELLATERLSTAYSSAKQDAKIPGRREVLKWLE
ncbi:hypothetical protein FRC17_001072 [Serendipita sp. 399]|nr:hypothetical protein FRC17_001072 [Serendipita sp. 399]